MGGDVEPGTTWVQRRSDLPEGWRRIVRVEKVDHSYIEGIGWPQQQFDGDAWTDATWPGARRRTRILRNQFTNRYVLLGTVTS